MVPRAARMVTVDMEASARRQLAAKEAAVCTLLHSACKVWLGDPCRLARHGNTNVSYMACRNAVYFIIRSHAARYDASVTKHCLSCQLHFSCTEYCHTQAVYPFIWEEIITCRFTLKLIVQTAS